MTDTWERAAAGWGRRADALRSATMPLSAWLLDQMRLQPGMTVLELAAGPGDTGFLAAELVQPGGKLICSDASEAMLALAGERAAAAGLTNVEFKRLELDWIDLDTAGVDVVLCRWGLMFSADPGAALREMRRVLRPGGRVALAVWDEAQANPWGTVRGRALVELGLADPPDPHVPGPFRLGDAGRLRELLDGAGFLEVVLEAVELPREYAGLDQYLAEVLDLSQPFVGVWERLSDAQRESVRERLVTLAAAFTGEDGIWRLPGRALAAAADA